MSFFANPRILTRLILLKRKKRAEIPSLLSHRPVGKQLIRIASRADIGDGNIFFRDSGLQKDPSVRLPEIQLPLSDHARLRRQNDRPAVFLRKRVIKLVRNILSNLVAVTADTRSHSADKVLRPASVFPLHGRHHLFSHTVHGSSPARMGESDRTMLRIHKV